MRFLLFFLPLLLSAQMLEVGQSVTPAFIKDQYDKPHIVGGERLWVVTWDKMSTRRANLYFSTRREMFKDKSTALIVDVSQTPSGIMNLFVVPRMQDYKHPVLLSTDKKYNAALPYRDGDITVVCLEKKKITQIRFAKNATELEAVLNEGCHENARP